MREYDVFSLSAPLETDDYVTVGRKTYSTYCRSEPKNLLTAVLNDGWKMEDFAVQEVQLAGGRNGSYTRYHFVVSRECGE